MDVPKVLYHAFRGSLVGDTLLPLNELPKHEATAHLYRAAHQKYNDRPELLSAPITGLDCWWGDVVFLCAIHPGEVFDEVGRAVEERDASQMGRFLDHRRQWKFIEIPVQELSPDRMVAYFCVGPTPREGHFHAFCEQNWPLYTVFSQFTRDQYREHVLRCRSSLKYWMGLPHILHRGPLSIAGKQPLQV